MTKEQKARKKEYNTLVNAIDYLAPRLEVAA
jgi:hypothetical protein